MGESINADNYVLQKRSRWVPTIVGMALVAAACTADTRSTSPPSTVTSSTTSTSLPSEQEAPPATEASTIWDPGAVSWSRQVVLPTGSPQLSGWYRDISPHPTGFMAAGLRRDGLLERPMAWLTPDGFRWAALAIPEDLEGRFNAVANNGEVTVLVGYDTADGAGLVVLVPRGSDPLHVGFADPVELTEVVSTASGFVAYGLTDPTSEDPQPALYTSVDGSTWIHLDVLALAAVTEVVPGPDGYLLEIEQLSAGQSVRIRQSSSLFGDVPEDSYSWPVELEVEAEFGLVYAMSAVATDGGFLIGGGNAVSGRPMIWRLRLPEQQAATTAALIAFEAPADSRLFGNLIDVRHLTRSEDRTFAIVSAHGGSAEVWSAADPTTWEFEDVIGVHPMSNFYASAQSFTGEVPAASDPGTPRTLVVTDGGFPSDIWAFGDRVVKLSGSDPVAYQQEVYPLFIGSAEGRLYARVVEHGPRWSQTELDVVRSRIFSLGDASWDEVGATAWDRGSRIQSVVGLGSRVAAFGTTADLSGDTGNQQFRVTESGLSDPMDLESRSNGVQMFQAAATSTTVVVVAANTQGSGNRILAWRSSDLGEWEQVTLDQTVDSYIGAVCAGIDRIWILGQRRSGFFSSVGAWSSVDGRTWVVSTPAVPGSDTAAEFTACAGDGERVVASFMTFAFGPGPSLMATGDGLSWEPVELPEGLLVRDRIVEVALDGERIGIVVQHPEDYFQPRHTAWLWDGETWHALEPEPGADVASIALRAGKVYLGGGSVDGSTIWQTQPR